MTLGISLARRDLALVGLGFLVGALALPWLPGPYLPASAWTAGGLAFLLPATALSMCVGQSVFAARSRTCVESSAASFRAVAAATTGLCSFALSLQILVLTTLIDAPLKASAPARVAVVLFGLHVAAIGNVLPRLRPGWPAVAAVPHPRHDAWMRIYRTVGYLCVVCGIGVAIVGATLGGRQVDAVLKVGLAGAALCLGWSLRRVRTA